MNFQWSFTGSILQFNKKKRIIYWNFLSKYVRIRKAWKKFVDLIIKNRLYLEVCLSYLIIKFELSIVWDSVFWIQIMLFSPVVGEGTAWRRHCFYSLWIKYYYCCYYYYYYYFVYHFFHIMFSPDTIFVVLTKGIRELALKMLQIKNKILRNYWDESEHMFLLTLTLWKWHAEAI